MPKVNKMILPELPIFNSEILENKYLDPAPYKGFRNYKQKGDQIQISTPFEGGVDFA